METDSPAPQTSYEKIYELMGAYCSADDEAEQRRHDWDIRVLAESDRSLDPELSYLLATYGPDEGLMPESSNKINQWKPYLGKLAFMPLGQNTTDPAWLGRFEELQFSVSWSEYAFDNIQWDQPGLTTDLHIYGASFLQLHNQCTSHYIDLGFQYSLNPSRQPSPLQIPLAMRHSIVPKPVPYEENEEGLDFSEPLNHYDHIDTDWLRIYRFRKPPRPFMFDDSIEQWFEAHSNISLLNECIEIIDSPAETQEAA